MPGKTVYRNQLSEAEVAERDRMRTMYDQWDKDGMQTVFTISNVWCTEPTARPETRAERIKRLEDLGQLDPNCPACREAYNHSTLRPFAPSHQPLSTCRSGKRPHCTCPACWG